MVCGAEVDQTYEGLEGCRYNSGWGDNNDD